MPCRARGPGGWLYPRKKAAQAAFFHLGPETPAISK